MPNYIENDEFIKLILIYRKTGNRILYNEIGKRFLVIAKNQLRLPIFINYSQDRHHEMVSDAVFYMTKNLADYDPMFASDDVSKGNPFSYFTTVARRAFFQKIAEYKKRDEILKPIGYIDNIQSSVCKKSTVFKEIIDPEIE